METTQVTAPAVRKTITVNADQQRAFEVFTTEFDSWWPRSHHIGKSPMTKAVIEGRAGGRLYSAQEDGTDCQWGTMLVWEPPSRFVWAWQIDGQWQLRHPDFLADTWGPGPCGDLLACDTSMNPMEFRREQSRMRRAARFMSRDCRDVRP